MMSLPAFMDLAQQCAPGVAPATMAAVVRAESSFRPYAIGVVHGRLLRQPARLDEAVATARALEVAGWNFSAGLAQINRANWTRLGLTPETVFTPCRNLAAGAAILQACFARAKRAYADPQTALHAALSCYTSGDFSTGYRIGYVQRVVSGVTSSPPLVPAIEPNSAPIPVVPLNRSPHAVGRTRVRVAPAPTSSEHADPSVDPPPAPARASAVVF